MKLSTLSVLLFGAAAIAKPLQHVHHMHRRDDVDADDVVVVKVTVTADGGPAQAPTSLPSSAPAASPAPPAQNNVAVAPSPEPSSSSNNFAPPPASPSPAAASSPAESPSSAPSHNSGPSSPKGDALGIVYSPYTPGGCKSASDVKSDLSKLSSYGLIRIYGTDCNQVEDVLAALNPGQKVFLGVFDLGQLQNSLSAIRDAVKPHGWDVVDTISIGNELVNNGKANPDQIGQAVREARSTLRGYGYTGPVVSVDTFIAVINNPALCEHSDYMAVNAHAFFDGNVEAQGAGKWLLNQIQRVSSACNGKKVVITESGWPSRGQSNGKCIPSKDNQNTAVSSIKSACGNDVILFTAFDDMWKQPGYLGVEQYWGIN